MTNLYKLVLIAGLALATAVPASAQQPNGELTFSGGAIAAGIGFTWADGKLHFNGQDYAFSVNGLSLADVGVSTVDGTGEVFNLQRIEDFPGTYVAASAGATLGGGAAVAALENDKGVRIYLHSSTAGLRVTLAADGIKFALK